MSHAHIEVVNQFIEVHFEVAKIKLRNIKGGEGGAKWGVDLNDVY
jgi:hypothetical protein